MSKSNCTFVRNVLSKSEFQSQTSFISTKSSVLSSCRICLSSILDPAMLTCGHRFCEKCLFQYWDDSDKPEFIVCPLCRGNAHKVHFAKKEYTSGMEDFRRIFNPLPKLSTSLNTARQEQQSVLKFCLKLSLLVPIFYCILNCVHIPLNFLRRVQQFFVKMVHKL